MNKLDQIVSTLESLPNDALDEVIDFLQFLKLKRGTGAMETALLTEKTLGKDWNRPEEDDAWKDL